MHINLEPVMYVGRGYQLADGYEQRRPYDLVFSVFKTAEGVARVYAAHGEIDRATFKEICKSLAEKGFHTALAEKGFHTALAEKGFHTALVERHGVEQKWSTGLEIPVSTERRE